MNIRTINDYNRALDRIEALLEEEAEDGTKAGKELKKLQKAVNKFESRNPELVAVA